MAESYRTGGGNYYNAQGGYVPGATFKFDALGRIVGGIGPNGEQLDETGRIVGFDYSQTGGSSTYNLNNARGLNPGQSQGTPASIAGAGSAGGYSTSGAGGPSAADDAKLAAARKQAFGSLAQGASYFGSPLGQQTQNAISSTLSGQNLPYTQPVQDRLFGQAADLNAGSRASQDDLIRRSLAERGMEGSGGGLAAMLGAGRDQSAANSQALSSIQNTATLENFSAQERARQQGESFLSSRSSAEAPYRLKEADLLSRSEVTGQDPFASALSSLFGFGTRGATGSPQQGTQMGLGTGGAFNVGGGVTSRSALGGQATVGPGSGSNTGVSAGGTPTRALQASPTPQASQARQAVQGYNADPANFRTAGSNSGYVPRMSGMEKAQNGINQIGDAAQKMWYGTQTWLG